MVVIESREIVRVYLSEYNNSISVDVLVIVNDINNQWAQISFNLDWFIIFFVMQFVYCNFSEVVIFCEVDS